MYNMKYILVLLTKMLQLPEARKQLDHSGGGGVAYCMSWCMYTVYIKYMIELSIYNISRYSMCRVHSIVYICSTVYIFIPMYIHSIHIRIVIYIHSMYILTHIYTCIYTNQTV